jgi:isoleucyl-tRNA synthetase
VIGLDTTLDEALTLEWYARDLIRAIQDTRKERGFEVTDRLMLSLTSENSLLLSLLGTHKDMIESETLCTLSQENLAWETVIDLDENLQIKIWLKK